MKINKFCKKDFAIQAQVISREIVDGEWVKFTVNVINVFKRGKTKIRRNEQTVWVPASDVRCRCPKLKVDKTYLMMGNDVIISQTPRVGIVIDSNSVVMKWSDGLAKRLKIVMRSEDNGKRC